MKKAVDISRWLGGLGKSHAELIERGLESDLPRFKVYPGADEYYLEPMPGVTYELDVESEILQVIFVCLIKRVDPQPEFQGFLPPPYGCLTKDTVRETWGSPVQARGEMSIPGIGKTGGWDSYDLTPLGVLGVELCYQYTIDLEVSAMVLKVKRDDA